ncbi:nucleoside-diphosphate-sugar epimerase [Rhodoligotrophos appendicifer]|uniref:SDR family oxidoreductase n=1 Tax=Rhodoligotrophos appendicifer TaxID=987056 RepID=UPI00117E459F|nr:SDR family oxidoreductase [Rhodoligotrophos appendicifer]
MSKLLCLGMGYSALAFARRMKAKGWSVTGTTRSAERARLLQEEGFETVLFDVTAGVEGDVLAGATHLLSSIPADADGDPVVRRLADDLNAHASQFGWVGYLSTTGVYGNHDGGWVDETTETVPLTERGGRRVLAETQWMDLHRQSGLPVHLFRLGGIYGPGRNTFLMLREGRAQRIIKPGQVFSRIHVDDIAGILNASIAHPSPGRAYNVCDDRPMPPQDIVTHAAGLLGVEPPPKIAFEDAEMSPMARAFYADSKRVSNRRVKDELGYQFRYPTYEEGLKALLEEGL